MDNTLSKCRYCGKEAEIVETKFRGVTVDYYIRCTHCNNRSYSCIRLETAIKEWNEENERGK